jgi:hypothetical protein
MANHKSLETTKIYIRPKSKTELRDKLQALREQKDKENEK